VTYPPRRTLPISRGIAAQLREIRRAREWTAADVGNAMVAEGFPAWRGHGVVGNLEQFRRESVSVDELPALARVLGVAPIHLLVPIHDPEFRITPACDPVPADQARAWFIGDDPSLCLDQQWWGRHRPYVARSGAAAARVVAGGSKVVERAADRER
jgi:transcriptional regulator with XRE-family HTH domain